MRKLMISIFQVSLVIILAVAVSVLFTEVAPAINLVMGTGLLLATKIKPGTSSSKLEEQRGMLLEEYEARVDEVNSLAEKEDRELTDEEKQLRNEYSKKLKEYDEEIKAAREFEEVAYDNAIIRSRQKNKPKSDEEKVVEKYSFARAIRAQLPNQKLDGVEREMHQEAENESKSNGLNLRGIGVPAMLLKRDVTATGGTSGDEGGVMVPTDLTDFIDTLVNKTVVSQMGARRYTGLTGNLDIPRKTSSSTATWEGENDQNAETTLEYDKVQMSPKRLSALIQVSKQLLLQAPYNVEADVRNDLIRETSIKVDAAAINGSSSDSNIPTGILNLISSNVVAIGATGGNIAWSHLVDLESKLADANADIEKLGYITNSKVRGAMKQTLINDVLGAYLWPVNAKDVNGYMVGISNNVPSNLTKSTGENLSAMIFANWDDLIIGQWGGLDIIVDPYSAKRYGLIDVNIDSWWDIALRRLESFAVCKDINTVIS